MGLRIAGKKKKIVMRNVEAGATPPYLEHLRRHSRRMIEGEVSDKENGSGKLKRRTVTYDKGKISAALPNSHMTYNPIRERRVAHARKEKRIRDHAGKTEPLFSRKSACD